MSTSFGTREGSADRGDRSLRPQHTRSTAAIRQTYHDVRTLASTLEETAFELRSLLRTQLEDRPYVTLTLASAFGYVVAGGPPARLAGLLLGLGSRLTLELFVRDLLGRAPETSAPPQAPQPRGID